MKKTAFLLLFYLCTGALAATNFTAWKLKNDFSSTKVWQHKSAQTLYVSIEKSSIPSEDEYKKFLGDFKKITKEKQDTLALIGVKEWKANSNKWTKVGSKNIFLIEGTYLDNSDDSVYFKEYHYVKGDKVLKILFTTTDNKSLTHEKDIQDFIAKVDLGEVNE